MTLIQKTPSPFTLIHCFLRIPLIFADSVATQQSDDNAVISCSQILVSTWFIHAFSWLWDGLGTSPCERRSLPMWVLSLSRQHPWNSLGKSAVFLV